ncbi:MAG: hypothetical protein AAF594_05580 [Bacteroidota bacterium]
MPHLRLGTLLLLVACGSATARDNDITLRYADGDTVRIRGQHAHTLGSAVWTDEAGADVIVALRELQPGRYATSASDYTRDVNGAFGSLDLEVEVRFTRRKAFPFEHRAQILGGRIGGRDVEGGAFTITNPNCTSPISRVPGGECGGDFNFAFGALPPDALTEVTLEPGEPFFFDTDGAACPVDLVEPLVGDRFVVTRTSADLGGASAPRCIRTGFGDDAWTSCGRVYSGRSADGCDDWEVVLHSFPVQDGSTPTYAVSVLANAECGGAERSCAWRNSTSTVVDAR